MIDEAEILKKYPPDKICDEWKWCIDEADRHMRDLHCECCDFYWELVELEENEQTKEVT